MARPQVTTNFPSGSAIATARSGSAISVTGLSGSVPDVMPLAKLLPHDAVEREHRPRHVLVDAVARAALLDERDNDGAHDQHDQHDAGVPRGETGANRPVHDAMGDTVQHDRPPGRFDDMNGGAGPGDTETVGVPDPPCASGPRIEMSGPASTALQSARAARADTAPHTGRSRWHGSVEP